MKLYIIRSRDTDWYWGGVRWVADLKNAILMAADEVKEVIRIVTRTRRQILCIQSRKELTMGQFIVLGLVGFLMFAMWACCKVSGEYDKKNDDNKEE